MGRILKFLRNLFSCHRKNRKNQEQAECTSSPTILAAVDFDSDNDVVALEKCSGSSNKNPHASLDHIETDDDGLQIFLETLLETVSAKTDAGNTNFYPQQSPWSEFSVIQTKNEFKLELEQPITDDNSQNDKIQFPDEEDADGDPKTDDYAVVDEKFMMSIREILFSTTSRQPEGDYSFNHKNDKELDRNAVDSEGGSDTSEDYWVMSLSPIPEESEPDGDSDDEPFGFPSLPENFL